ncbi:anaerobic ribonucleoside-triphosphate reductase activating protein [bacterium]|nr:anaerobic ribonucleoside-triphosphate reductase activating protein [bacterium]
MREIQIGGLVSFTTIDYPGKLAAVLFLRGCPLRCAYCSNRHLLDLGDGEYDPEKVFEFLQNRVGKLEAVVFSGGEALMQSDALIEYMRRVKALGFLIGLHTNGFYPAALSRVADLVDWVGLDFKATAAGYAKLVHNTVAYDQMIKSLDTWVATGRALEVRTTCDPRHVTKSDLLEIARECALRGVKNFAVQKYIPHFDDETDTTADGREQFFNDDALRNQINAMFETVTWRE